MVQAMASERDPRVLDSALLDRVSAEARNSPRGRRNFNLHLADGDPCHRLMNAIEPGSYVAPHRHLDAAKDETIVVLRGRLIVVVFDDEGRETSRVALAAGGDLFGVDVPHGTFHTLWALDPGTVFFESKAGPYLPMAEAERALWAPAEGNAGAADWLRRLAGSASLGEA